MTRDITLEACVDNVETALAAQELGVDRIELCADLLEGGITPSAGMIASARQALRIPLFVIIRPRGGDFCYSPREREVMQRDIHFARQAGVDGIVSGILQTDGAVDIAGMRRLREAAQPLPLTFHRAFDLTRDPREALEELIELGVDRILTSGQAPSALDGAPLIAALIAQAGGRIRIMPGGGVTEHNIQVILQQTSATEIHVRAAGTRDSPMQYRNPRVLLSGSAGAGEYLLPAIESPRLRGCVEALKR